MHGCWQNVEGLGPRAELGVGLGGPRGHWELHGSRPMVRWSQALRAMQLEGLGLSRLGTTCPACMACPSHWSVASSSAIPQGCPAPWPSPTPRSSPSIYSLKALHTAASPPSASTLWLLHSKDRASARAQGSLAGFQS